jgi:hypothetical protein
LASRQNEIFAELGVLDEPEPVNPYVALGIDANFADQLLKEDRSGAALKSYSNGVYRLLTRRYHADIQDTANPERFREITDAIEKIESANRSALSRWSRLGRPAVSLQFDKVRKENEEVINRTTELIQTDLENGHDPNHYSQIAWAQGLLVGSRNLTFLMRRVGHGGMSIIFGQKQPLTSGGRAKGENQSIDIQTFLRTNKNFGLPADTQLSVYIDENGRSTILDPSLRFLMDITDPIARYRSRRERYTNAKLNEIGSSDLWSRAKDPIIFITTTSSVENQKKAVETSIISFPRQIQEATTIWHIPYEVAGSFADDSFFRRMRATSRSGQLALNGGTAAAETRGFTFVSAKTRSLVDQDVGYTPVMQPGNSLMMYDSTLRIPIATDAKVIGILGSNSYAK